MAHQADLSEIEFVDDIEREYFAEAQLGLQVYDFLQSPVGRYLHGRARLELQIVKDEMAEIKWPFSYFGKRKWRALKIRQETAESFMRWMAEAITTGSQAEKQLEEYRN